MVKTKNIIEKNKFIRKLTYFDDHNQDLLDPFACEEFKVLGLEKGKYEALCLQLVLRKSEYATMMMRELLKSSSSHKNQLDFNKFVSDLVKSS